MSDFFDRLDYQLNPDGVPCARCGGVARGYAHIGNDRYCHPNRDDKPDCYTLAMHDGAGNAHYLNTIREWRAQLAEGDQ